jgi:hypothetical protein
VPRFFGFIFFVAGMLIGIFVPVFGLIFLVSHGLTGLGIMLYSLNIMNIFVVISDAPRYLIILLILLILGLFIAAIVFVIMCNFPKNREKKYFICYPFICFFFLILILKLLPYFIRFLI